MCGRFSLASPLDKLKERYRLKAIDSENLFMPRWNISPNSSCAIVNRVDNYNKLGFMRWGFNPGIKNVKFKPPINARIETITKSPLFKTSISGRRCIVPADGFYEFEQVGNKKQPWYFYYSNNQILSLGAIFTINKETSELSFTIITMAPSKEVAKIHDRMPLIVTDEYLDLWLSYEELDLKLHALQNSSLNETRLVARRVTADVNNPKIDTPKLVDFI